MRLGIFGGTFDPPHLGHLILAAEALYQLKLDRLLWVLTPAPPHKRGQRVTSLAQRLEMLRAALDDAPEFELSTVDIDRPSPHYALDTMHILREENPGASLIYLMGGDSLRDLHAWYRPTEFVQVCQELGVMRRPGDNIDPFIIEAQVPGAAAKVRFIEAPLLEIASHQIRKRAAQNAPYRYYLPPAVYEIIQRKTLYMQE